MREVEWTETALENMAALDKGIAQRVKRAVERFADTGAGSVKKLHGIDPSEYRLRVGTTVCGSIRTARRFGCCASAIAERLIGREASAPTLHSLPPKSSGHTDP